MKVHGAADIIDKHMNSTKIIHYNRSGSWRIVIPLSIILYAGSFYFIFPFRWYLYFMFLGGIISCLINFTKYAEISPAGLENYTFFPYLSKHITIPWHSVEDIQTSEIERKLIVGGLYGVLAPFKRDTISINLKAKLAGHEKYSFKKNQKRFFHPTIEVRKDGLEIVVIKSPPKGYRALCEDCAHFTNVKRISAADDYQRKNSIVIDVATILFVSLIIYGVIELTKPY